jgi:Zn ribbon nucleic-acid-binding protein
LPRFSVLYNKCINCGFEGKGFEHVVKNFKVASSNMAFNEDIIQVVVLLECPKCGFQRKFSYAYSTDKKIAEKISNNKK